MLLLVCFVYTVIMIVFTFFKTRDLISCCQVTVRLLGLFNFLLVPCYKLSIN